MAHDIPAASGFTGHARTTLQYGEEFRRLVGKIKQADFSDADWAPIEALVDTGNFERVGVFLGAQAEIIDWTKYKFYVSQYGGMTEWEGSLRAITEHGSRVFQELEERNTREGETDVSNTVTVFEFNDAGKIGHLDVYVMPLRKE